MITYKKKIKQAKQTTYHPPPLPIHSLDLFRLHIVTITIQINNVSEGFVGKQKRHGCNWTFVWAE